jgi:photosystem II stability/assembly factor-like uncharacterized protein
MLLGNMLRFLLASFMLCATRFVASAQSTSPWEMEKSGTTASLRGVHAVGGGVVWASGTNGTVLRTEDSGYMWQSCAMPPGAEKLDFRAIWAWDANTAIVMSSGAGLLSRLYETTDGCSHWILLYTNPDKEGFWDAMIFQNRQKAYILGDPVGDRFILLTTKNGGETWKHSDAPGLETMTDAKGAFAASNSSLLARTQEPLLFGTGGAYVYAQSHTGSVDFSAPRSPKPIKMTEVWQRSTVPIANQGEAAGIFSLGYHTLDKTGYGYTLVAVGGDYKQPDERSGTAAWSRDGAHWTASATPPGGYRSAVAWDADHKLWITVGPNGSDLSRDDGKTWQSIEQAPADMGKGGEWNALSLPWVVGPNGRIAKLNAEALPAPPSPGPGSRIKPPSGIRPRHPQ